MQFNWFSLLLMSAAAISAGTGAYLLSNTGLRGVKYFAYSFFAMALWAFSNSVELLSDDLHVKILLTKISYFGIISAVPLLFYFSAAYTGRKEYNSAKWYAIIWTIPVIILLLAFTNEMHYLQWKSYTLTNSVAGEVVYYESGPGVYIVAVYSYLLMTISYIFLIGNLARNHKLYKKQLLLLLLALLIPWFLNITYITRTSPFPELDFAPIGLVFSNILVLTAIWRFRLLYLLPQAKELLFASIPDPILVVNLEFTVTDYNPAAARLLENDSIVNTNLAQLLPGLNVATSASTALNIEYNYRENGRNLWFDAGFSILRKGSGLPEGYMIVLRNITKRKIAEESLKESEIMLKELNDSKDKFFSIISHDLKNPFSNLMNISKILIEDKDTMEEAEYNNFLDLLSKISHSSYELLENLLQWSRSQTGSLRYSPVEIPVIELINRAVTEVKHSAVNKNIEIIYPGRTEGIAFCDQEMIAVVLRNLLMNAIKFSYAGGKVEIGFENREKDHLVLIKDHGVGMSGEVLRTLFKVGYNSSRSGTANEQGTGLGLILCKEFIVKNGGEIWAESKQGDGSVFYLTLKKA